MSSINKVLYTGVTNDLVRRILQHRSDLFEGFSHKYKTNRLVYFEYFNDITQAIYREKEIKKWRREKKIKLIEKENPSWRDLYNDVVDFYRASSIKKV